MANGSLLGGIPFGIKDIGVIYMYVAVLQYLGSFTRSTLFTSERKTAW